MHIIQDMNKAPEGSTIIYLLIGDGRTEEHILPAIFSRFTRDDIYVLYQPQPKPTPGAGFSALRIIPRLPLTHPNRFLLIVDREKIEGAEITKGILHPYIKRYIPSIDIHHEEFLDRCGFLFFCKERTRRFSLYIAICGKSKEIEEELSIFLKRVNGIDVEPNHHLWTDLRRDHKLSISDVQELLRRSSIKQIQASFPSLNAVLSHIEQYGAEIPEIP